MSFRFCGLGVFTVSGTYELKNKTPYRLILSQVRKGAYPLDPQKPKTEIGLGVIFGVVEISLFCG